MFYNTEDRFSGDIANVIFFAHFVKRNGACYLSHWSSRLSSFNG